MGSGWADVFRSGGSSGGSSARSRRTTYANSMDWIDDIF